MPQEIRIQTANFTAEYGNNSGSQVSVTEAGTTSSMAPREFCAMTN
jgi:hypothetical protein